MDSYQSVVCRVCVDVTRPTFPTAMRKCEQSTLCTYFAMEKKNDTFISEILIAINYDDRTYKRTTRTSVERLNDVPIKEIFKSRLALTCFVLSFTEEPPM